MRLAFAAVAVAMLCGPAEAHSWYADRRDPVFNGTTCCGGSDCRELPPGAISNTPQGLRVTLSLQQARFINPLRIEPFDEVIPFDRVQMSEDGRAHICLMSRSFDDRHGYYCIFLPPTT